METPDSVQIPGRCCATFTDHAVTVCTLVTLIGGRLASGFSRPALRRVPSFDRSSQGLLAEAQPPPDFDDLIVQGSPLKLPGLVPTFEPDDEPLVVPSSVLMHGPNDEPLVVMQGSPLRLTIDTPTARGAGDVDGSLSDSPGSDSGLRI